MMKRFLILLLVLVLFSTTSLFAATTYDKEYKKQHKKYATSLDKDQIDKRNRQLITNRSEDSLAKVSPNLLNLIDNSNSSNKKEASDILKRMDTLITSNEARSKGLNKTTGDLVYVYIQFSNQVDLQVADDYINTVINQDEETQTIAAWISIDRIYDLAALEEVLLIEPVIPPVVHSITSEGDNIHNASFFRESTGLDGKGIKIGVISDGVNNWTDARDAGELPDITVLSNNTGGDEGTALLEIIHDLAPSADLYFHDCGQNTIAFKEAIKALVDSGCNVIVDDIGWPSEPYFEDGSIARFVRKSITDSRNSFIYITSAGNASMGHYQDIFNGDNNNFHDFSENEGIQSLPVYVPPNGLIQVVLQWDDRFGWSSNDYDLYLFDETYSLLNEEGGMSTQNGHSNPMEYTYYYNQTSEAQLIYVDVHKFSGTGKTLELYVYGGYFLDYSTVEDSIFGHAAVPEVITVGAINANHYDGTPNTTYEIANYSSQGDVTIKYPRTEVRNKPDICGISGVSVSGAGGFPSTFYGTSASAPHIAALTALIWCQSPNQKASQVKKILLDSTIDLGKSGRDSAYGYGLAYINETILLPEKPTILFAIPLDSSVIFSWLPYTSSRISGYQVSYKLTNETKWTELDVIKRETSITIDGLENGGAYQFRVRAKIKKNNYSAYSDVLTATPIDFTSFEYPSTLIN